MSAFQHNNSVAEDSSDIDSEDMEDARDFDQTRQDNHNAAADSEITGTALNDLHISDGDHHIDTEPSTEGIIEVIEEKVVPKNLEEALREKEAGNEFFRSRDFEQAVFHYSLAIDLCPDSEKEHLAVFYGNRSAAFIGLDDYEAVIEDCSAALERKPDYVKVLARRSQAQEKLDKIDEALAGTEYV